MRPRCSRVKARVSRFAAKGVEAVPSEGVDEAVVKFGRQLALWYGRADELYERAAQIWETPSGQQARVQLTEAWKRDELAAPPGSTFAARTGRGSACVGEPTAWAKSFPSSRNR